MHRTTYASISTFIATLLVLTSSMSNAHADAAPPLQPQGSNINATVKTNVAMRAEFVTLDIESFIVPDTTTSTGVNLNMSDLAGVRVNAVFTMSNLGTADETLAVRFPLNRLDASGDGYGGDPTVTGFAVSADKKLLTTRVVTNGIAAKDAFDIPVQWATFNVTFPAKKDVVISVTYGLSATGYIPEGTFYYTLQTGAGWRGPIGQGTVLLRLPYPATRDNVYLSDGRLARRGVFDGNTVRWSFRNIEPTAADDIAFSIVDPARWQSFLSAQRVAKTNPASGEAQLALGNAYWSMVFVGKGAPEGNTARFAAPAVKAMRAAAKALPNDLLAQLSASEVLLFGEFNAYEPVSEKQYVAIDDVVTLLETAFKLAPRNAKAGEQLQTAYLQVTNWIPGANAKGKRIDALVARMKALAGREGVKLD